MRKRLHKVHLVNPVYKWPKERERERERERPSLPPSSDRAFDEQSDKS